MEIILCRHGETDTNVKGNTHLREDEVGLNTVGLKQAGSLAKLGTEHSVTAIFTSPEKRAVETGQAVGHELGLMPAIIPDLRERDWGDWNGQPWSEIEPRLRGKSLEERYKFLPPNGESWEQMLHRLTRVVDEIAKKAVGNVMIVTHGGALRAIVPELKGEDLAASLKYNFDNASVTSFSYNDPGAYELLLENDTAHLHS